MGAPNDASLMNYYRETFDEDQAGIPQPRLLSPDELLPPARAIYEANIRRLGVDAIPVILDPNKQAGDYGFKVDSTQDLPHKPPAGVGDHYIAISEYWHQWSAADARANLQESNQELTVRTRVTDPVLLTANERAAARLHVSPVPILYYATEADGETRMYSAESKEGVRYTVLDGNESRDMQLASIPHEMGHHLLGHVKAETLATLHNANMKLGAMSQDMERAADRQAVIACGGEQLAAALLSWHNRDQASAAANAQLASSFGLSSRAADYVPRDENHPADAERIAALHAGAQEMAAKGTCPVDPALLAGSLRGLKTTAGGEHVTGHETSNVMSGKPVGSGRVLS